MRLYGLDADAQVVGNLFVEPTRHNALEHLSFAQGQLGEKGVAVDGLLVHAEALAGMVQHALHQADQFDFIKRLLNKVHSPFLHGFDSHRHIAMAGNEHHG